jgi:DNA-binding NarL/FixJ family response regulator
MEMSATASSTESLSVGAPAALVMESLRRLELEAGKGAARPLPRLSARQLEVLTLLCEGMPNKIICRQLNIANGTVKAHVGIILRELGVSTRLQAVIAAQRCGLVGGAVTGR